jgi:hypothetical protein
MLTPMLLALAVLSAQQKPDIDAQMLERINFYRKAAGQEPVAMDPELSKGCSLHAQYLVKNSNHPSTQGLGVHNEDPKLPGFSKEGAKAGEASVSFPTGDALEAIDKWMASLFHRVPLLDPQLVKVGLGFAKGGKYGGYVLVDTISARERMPNHPPIYYPADGQKDVPLAFVPDIPNPIPEHKGKPAGYPVTVTFPEEKKPGEKYMVTDATATLVDGGKKEVAVYLSSLEKPAAGQAVYQRNTICLFPKAPLKPNTTYTVTIKAMVDKAEWSKTWTFTTGAAKK